MTQIVVYPYKMGSASARSIAKGLGVRRVWSRGKYRPRQNDLVINWGSAEIPQWNDRLERQGGNMLNKPWNVSLAIDKLMTYKELKDKGVNTLEFTTKCSVAYDWLLNGKTVYARTLTRSSGGKGIVVMRSPNDYVDSQLYTLGENVMAEYRVHVFNGQVIDYTKKRRRSGVEFNDTSESIRNHDNGWVFCRDNLRRLERVEQLALDSVKALGLDFGAVDIIMCEDRTVKTLEVNTACGLEGTTLSNYINAIKQYANTL